MQNDLNIRIGQPSDINSIHKIEESVFKNDSWSLEMIFEELNDELNRTTWLLELKKNIIGYCMTRSGLNETHLINMAIDRAYQKRGFGKKLLDHFLYTALDKSSVFLEVKHGNFPAINLYLEAGFKETSICNNYYSDGSAAILMRFNKK